MSTAAKCPLQPSLTIECPVCHAAPESPCKDSGGAYRAPHVERGRTERWARMGLGE